MMCPSCSGQKAISGVGCGPDGCRPLDLTCWDCNGTGEITESQAAAMRAGARLRSMRRARDLSLREAAKAFGVPAYEWSDAERGRIDVERFVRFLESMNT